MSIDFNPSYIERRLDRLIEEFREQRVELRMIDYKLSVLTSRKDVINARDEILTELRHLIGQGGQTLK